MDEEYGTVEYFWEDDLYQLNLREGDDYRHEGDTGDEDLEYCDCGTLLDSEGECPVCDWEPDAHLESVYEDQYEVGE
jgi:hypothetical protein